MFINESLVFVELHKTGGTHIGKLLQELLPGKQVEKHNPPPRDLWDRFILGSVRNPWDWYVSLWAYGCSGRGAIQTRTTRRLEPGYAFEQLYYEMELPRTRLDVGIRQLFRNRQKPVGIWRDLYHDADDATAFREWIRMIYDHDRRFDVGEGYGFSPVSEWAGLMTYRYLRLFSTHREALYSDPLLANPGTVIHSFPKCRLADFLVRNEHLEDDLIEGLSLAGVRLSAGQRSHILGAKDQKTNPSARKAVHHYYDTSTAELVARRERLIIQEHKYTPPFAA